MGIVNFLLFAGKGQRSLYIFDKKKTIAAACISALRLSLN